MRNQPRAVAAATLAALIMAAPVAESARGTEPVSTAWVSNIAGSAQLNGPILASGLLVDTKGQPASGHVSVVAWPRPEVMARLEVGDAVKTAQVAKATVGPDGSFALRLDPAVPLAEFMLPDGTVNFDLWGETAGGSALFSFPRRLESGSQPAWGDPQAVRSPELAAAKVLEVTLRTQAASTVAQESAPAPLPASDKACVNTVVAIYNQRIGVVGEVYAGPNSTADFQYVNGSSSNLGVGFSATGLSGTFSASGTAAMSSTGTIDYPTQAANRITVFQTTFGYHKIHRQVSGKAGCVDQGYVVRPYQWQGGASTYTTAAAPTVTMTNCSAIRAGVTITKDTARAITFSNGLEISGVIGIDLSTQTGFNTSTRIRHMFFSAGLLCGTNDTWPNAARIVGR